MNGYEKACNDRCQWCRNGDQLTADRKVHVLPREYPARWPKCTAPTRDQYIAELEKRLEETETIASHREAALARSLAYEAHMKAQLAEARKDSARLAMATQFTFVTPSGRHLTVNKCFGRYLPVQPFMWSVRDEFGNVYLTDGSCAYELFPSDRDGEFYQKYRFATYEEAVNAVKSAMAAEGEGK